MQEISKLVLETGISAASFVFLVFFSYYMATKSYPNLSHYASQLEELNRQSTEANEKFTEAIYELSRSNENIKQTLDVFNSTMQGQNKLMDLLTVYARETRDILSVHDERGQQMHSMLCAVCNKMEADDENKKRSSPLD